MVVVSPALDASISPRDLKRKGILKDAEDFRQLLLLQDFSLLCITTIHSGRLDRHVEFGPAPACFACDSNKKHVQS